MSEKASRKPKFKVYEEEVKTSHTTHWDWDYISREEIDRLLFNRRASPTSPSYLLAARRVLWKGAIITLGMLSVGTLIAVIGNYFGSA